MRIEIFSALLSLEAKKQVFLNLEYKMEKKYTQEIKKFKNIYSSCENGFKRRFCRPYF